MTFWCGSESADPCLWLWIRILLFSSLTFKTPTKRWFFFSFSASYFLKVHLHHFLKIKSQKSHKTEDIKVFLSIWYLIIEGSGPGRPKNMWIRIRIRNTDHNTRLNNLRLVKENSKEEVLTYQPSEPQQAPLSPAGAVPAGCLLDSASWLLRSPDSASQTDCWPEESAGICETFWNQQIWGLNFKFKWASNAKKCMDGNKNKKGDDHISEGFLEIGLS